MGGCDLWIDLDLDVTYGSTGTWTLFFRCLYIPAVDDPAYDISQHFAETLHFITQETSRGHATLVHCGAGVSRAASIVTSYLMLSPEYRLTFTHAEFYVHHRRSRIEINAGFVAALERLDAELQTTVTD
jgi:protein-tyrosine phosphatase